MDNKSEVSSSMIKQSTCFSRMFSFCKLPSDNEDFTSKRSFLAHPSSIISYNSLSSKKEVKSPEKNGARFTFGIPSSPTPVHLMMEKDVLPMNIVFILGVEHKIVAKITHKKVGPLPPAQNNRSSFGNSENGRDSTIRKKDSLKDSLLNSLKRSFASQDKISIKTEKDSGTIPENIASYIANRLKYDIIIDALCGCGGVTTQVNCLFFT